MKKIGTLILAIGLVLGIVGCKAEVTEEEPVVVEEDDTTDTAETPKYTITYDAAGHGTAPEAKTVEEGYKLTEADLPALTADGFDFGGWKFNEKIVAAGEEVVSDMTLIAAWTEWGTVATPTFSVAAGEVDKGTKVTIKSATEGAVIYYTTDGSAPTAGSTKYESEIEITPPMTIKAFAVKSGLKNSGVASAEYKVKLYTVTFDANGHGTAPDAMKGYKGQTITLPAALTEAGWLFEKWNNGTADYDAGASYTVNGNVTIKAVWKEIPNVTDLTAKCTASGTVKLTWTNPTDADFAKVVITYGTTGKVEVLKTATPNDEATVTGLTNGTEYTFTVKAYDTAENESSGVSVNCTPGFGRLIGTPTGGQTQGAVLKDTLKETWMAANGNLKVDGTEIAKTSEVVVVPTGTVATVTMPDDSSWSSYYSGTNTEYKGVFFKDRKVKLDPFVMSQYQVTQKLYEKVMGNNPSSFSSNPYGSEIQENRPVEKVTWFQACAFCNELTKKTFGETTDQCVYYSNEGCTAPYTKENANSNVTVYAAYNTETKKWTKKGYRLPTEAEWEFAARGGDPNALDSNNKSIWSYAYAGVQTKKEASKFTSSPNNDTELESYAWYSNNAGNKTHEVGLKAENKLNLYDMSGNVYEWCYDWYNSTASSNDSAYTVDGYAQNPLGSSSGANRVLRGGYYNYYAYGCSVSYRAGGYPSGGSHIGFRVVRSSSN